MEGERYKRDPELVRMMMKDFPAIPAKEKFLVVKRWDAMLEGDEPEIAVFFAKPDVLAGLFMLANYDYEDNMGVISPMCSGCAAIIHYPWFQREEEKPKAILGMFDPSARPCVHKDVLTLAMPYKRLAQIINFMDESFLITDTWKTLKRRI